MKNILILTSLILISLSSCTKKKCPAECRSNIAGCNETVPVDELCQAAFNRWFYSKSTGKCTLIGYSGCSQKGFETEQECLECDCNTTYESVPVCIEEKLVTFKDEQTQQGIKLETYTFQNATVYAFDYGSISDASIEVYDTECTHLGTLNGLAGLTEINGVEFFPNASLIRVVWQR